MQRYKIDAPLLVAGLLTWGMSQGSSDVLQPWLFKFVFCKKKRNKRLMLLLDSIQELMNGIYYM